MKKAMNNQDNDEMRPEYDLRSGVRGKYYERYKQGSNTILTVLLLVAAPASATPAQPSQSPSTASRGSSLPVELVAERCPDFHVGDHRVDDIVRCRVLASGTFARLGSDVYYYAFYCVEERSAPEFGSCDDSSSINGGHPRQNIAVFVRRNKAPSLQLVTFAFAPTGDFKKPNWGDYVTKPSIVVTPYGRIMELPLILAASCDCNASIYYLWEPTQRHWKELDFTAWQYQLKRQLADSIAAWGDPPWPVLRNMTVSGPLWRNEDAHCCPSGGSYTGRLAISNGKFVLKSVRISSSDKPKAQQD